MGSLFRLKTQRVLLTWSAPRQTPPRLVAQALPPVRFRVVDTGVHVDVSVDSEQPPYLFEQTDYKVMVRALVDEPVTLAQRDPILLSDMEREDNDRLWFGVVNYGGQVGVSTWRVFVGGVLELELELEVFPSKLSYRADYDAIMADVQSILTGLALTYLRATTQLGSAMLGAHSTEIEWVTLLRLLCDELEQSLMFIAHHPTSMMESVVQVQPIARARAGHRAMRRALVRGQGKGAVEVIHGVPVRAKVPTLKRQPTLDTPTHRWMAQALDEVWYRLISLVRRESQRQSHPSSRAMATFEELNGLARRVDRLRHIGPWRGFVTDGQVTRPVQTQLAPGYAQAFRVLRMLSYGIVLREGPLQLNVKDISRLYEYWCYLVFVQILQQLTRAQVEMSSLFRLKQNGLEVLLEQGQTNAIRMALQGGGACVLTYNPTLSTAGVFAQKPDMVLSFEREGWPTLHLVFDAKYRLDPQGEVGPPMDAINALHRYRDAIIAEQGDRAVHQVVQAVALFPYKEPEHERGSYEDNRHWKSLAKYGVGAIPLLPGQTDYASRWLDGLLADHGWGLAQGAVSHVAIEALFEKQMHSESIALVGVLRREWSAHLEWIRQNRCYYMPHYVEHPKQMQAKWVAFYVPRHDHVPGSIYEVARVEHIEVKPRAEIQTPWSTRQPDALQVVYTLGAMSSLSSPIENVRRETYAAQRFSISRWTSALALVHATHVAELVIRSTWAWSLYDGVRHFDDAVIVMRFDGAMEKIWFVSALWHVWRTVDGHGYQVLWQEQILDFETQADVFAFLGSL